MQLVRVVPFSFFKVQLRCILLLRAGVSCLQSSSLIDNAKIQNNKPDSKLIGLIKLAKITQGSPICQGLWQQKAQTKSSFSMGKKLLFDE